MARKKNFDAQLALRQGNVPLNRRHIKDYAKLYAEDIIDALYDIVTDDGNYARDRIQAGEAILNRAYGRPSDGKNIPEIPEAATIDMEKLPTSELMAMLSKMQQDEIEEAQITQVESKMLDAPDEKEAEEVDK